MKWNYHKPVFEYEEAFADAEWPWVGHKHFAYDLVSNVKPKKIVELGTHKGTSFFSFCQAAKDQKLNVEISAVDTWQGDEHAGFYGDEIYGGVKNIVEKYYSTLDAHLIRKTFDEALSGFDNKSIDILHIDGLHTYEAVKHDLESWFDKVSEGGIILFHDIVVQHGDFGVYKLWDELKKKYETLEFHHSNGLGVLFKDGQKFKEQNNLQEIWFYHYEIVAGSKYLQFKLANGTGDDLEKLLLTSKNIEQKAFELNRLLTEKGYENQELLSSPQWKLCNRIYAVIKKILK